MTDKKSNDSRRKLLKSLAAGSGAVVAGKSLPESWAKPVIDTVVLPAHAATTDDVASEGGDVTTTLQATTLPPLTYFNTDLPFLDLDAQLVDDAEKEHLFAGIIDALVPTAEARPSSIGGMSVVISGTSAAVRFLGAQRTRIHNVVAPIDGTPSGKPVLEAGACSVPSKGPTSVQLVNYALGDASVLVRVNGGNGVWVVRVPMKPIGSLSVNCPTTQST